METTGPNGVGLQPPGPRTVPAQAFADIVYRLTVDLQVRLAPDGLEVLARRFGSNLGPYLTTLGDLHPRRDLWTDPGLAFLPAFVMRVVDQIGWDLRNKSNARETLPTSALRAPAVEDACRSIMRSPPVRRECATIVAKVKKELGVSPLVATPICPDYSDVR